MGRASCRRQRHTWESGKVASCGSWFPRMTILCGWGLRREPKIQAKLRVADLGGGSVVGPIATVDEDVTHRKRRGGSREGGIWCGEGGIWCGEGWIWCGEGWIWCGEGGIWWLRQLCLVAMGI